MSPPSTPQTKQYAPLVPSPLNPVSSPSCPNRKATPHSPSPKPKSRPASQASPTQLLLRQKAAAAFRYHKSSSIPSNNNYYSNYVPLGSRPSPISIFGGAGSKRRTQQQRLSLASELEKQMDLEFFSTYLEDDLTIWTPEDTINMIRGLDFDDDNTANTGDLGLALSTTMTMNMVKVKEDDGDQDAEEEQKEDTPMLESARQVEGEKRILTPGTRRNPRERGQNATITLRRVMVLAGILVGFVLVHGLVSTFGPAAEARRNVQEE
ncbi:hypothetical protein QBC44DRAFT_158522 [Cladorrhinum sp. PSN332]|nr:hypothetical protein QBC44DRAFT_158522 [Cladorrhinum sp. PSN332]